VYDEPLFGRRSILVLFGACLAILFSAFEVRQPVFSLWTFNFTTAELATDFFLVTVAIWATASPARFFSRRVLDLAVLLFVISNYLSVLFAADQASALKFSLRMTSAGLVYLGISRLPARYRSHLVVGAAVVVTTLLVTGIGLVENFVPGVDWHSLLSPLQEGVFTFGTYFNVRISASFPFPTVLSMYLELALPLVLAMGLWLMTMEKKTRAWRNRWAVATILAATAILAVQIFTYTRSTLIATPASMLAGAGCALFFGFPRRVAACFGLAVLILAVLLAASVLFSDTMGARLGLEDTGKHYEARYELLNFPDTVQPGGEYTAGLRLTNTSDVTWQKTGSGNFVVTYRWQGYPGEEHLGELDSLTTELPRDVAPGESVDVAARFATPDQAGKYILIVELVKTGVGWFSAGGVTPVVVPVDVGNPGGARFTIPNPPEDFLWVDPKQQSLSRAVLWRAALDIWKDHPVLGVGAGQFRKVYSEFVPGLQPDERIETNNIFLEALANTGLVGLAAMLFLLASAGWYQLRVVTSRSLEPSFRLVSLGLLAALTAYVFHGILDFFLWQNGVTFLFFTLLGLTAWLMEQNKRESS
jgi:hypothetical protein